MQGDCKKRIYISAHTFTLYRELINNASPIAMTGITVQNNGGTATDYSLFQNCQRLALILERKRKYFQVISSEISDLSLL